MAATTAAGDGLHHRVSAVIAALDPAARRLTLNGVVVDGGLSHDGVVAEFDRGVLRVTGADDLTGPRRQALLDAARQTLLLGASLPVGRLAASQAVTIAGEDFIVATVKGPTAFLFSATDHRMAGEKPSTYPAQAGNFDDLRLDFDTTGQRVVGAERCVAAAVDPLGGPWRVLRLVLTFPVPIDRPDGRS